MDKVYVGQLNRRITISSLSDDKNTVGETVKTKTTVLETWAKVTHNKVTQTDDDFQVVSFNERSYFIRYVKDILDSGETYVLEDVLDLGEFEIIGVQMIGFKEYLKLRVVRRE